MTSKNVAVLSSNKNESKQTKTNDDQTISNISNDDIGLGYFKELPCGNTTDAMVATIIPLSDSVFKCFVETFITI